MRSSISSSEPTATLARLWLQVFAVCFVGVVALLGLTLITPPPYGDLTRVGALSEDDFGWRAPQPAIALASLYSADLREADVLVIGDSFSIAPGNPVPVGSLLWQSRLVESGYRVATMHWSRSHPLCPDFPAWLHKQGFQGRWILLESVERELQANLQSPEHCDPIKRADGRAFSAPLPPQQPPAFHLNTGERLLTGASTLWNTWRALRSMQPAVYADPSASEKTRLHPYAPGCMRFSNRSCDRALFLAEDELKPRFQASQVGAIAKATVTPGPWRTAWLVIPNKTTFYLDPEPSRAPSRLLATQELGPDLLAAFEQQGSTVQDLYYPNDTHLSPRGALVLGDTVLGWLRAHERKPN